MQLLDLLWHSRPKINIFQWKIDIRGGRFYSDWISKSLLVSIKGCSAYRASAGDVFPGSSNLRGVVTSGLSWASLFIPAYPSVSPCDTCKTLDNLLGKMWKEFTPPFPIFWTPAPFQLPRQFCFLPSIAWWVTLRAHTPQWGLSSCSQLMLLRGFFFMRFPDGRPRYARRTLALKLYPFQSSFLGQEQADLALLLLFALAKLSCTCIAGKPPFLQATDCHFTALCLEVAWYNFKDPLRSP